MRPPVSEPPDGSSGVIPHDHGAPPQFRDRPRALRTPPLFPRPRTRGVATIVRAPGRTHSCSRSSPVESGAARALGAARRLPFSDAASARSPVGTAPARFPASRAISRALGPLRRRRSTRTRRRHEPRERGAPRRLPRSSDGFPSPIRPSPVVPSPVLRLITWNLNSIRTRRARLLRLLERHEPDVVCLQELRAPSEEFPRLPVEAAGYHAAVHAQAARNGVAILSRDPAEVRARGLPPCRARGEARLVEVEVAGLRVLSAYVPNGKSVTHEDWAYKLEWLEALREHLRRTASPETPLVLGGDFNVAPVDRDTAEVDPGGVLCHPTARAGLADLVSWGLRDAFREIHAVGDEPEKGLYTWWDYTRLSFARNVGARIDHFYLTAPLAGRLASVFVDRDERRQRKGEDIPSDHAPLVCDLRW